MAYSKEVKNKKTLLKEHSFINVMYLKEMMVHRWVKKFVRKHGNDTEKEYTLWLNR